MNHFKTNCGDVEAQEMTINGSTDIDGIGQVVILRELNIKRV
ncbi:hypothetical protein [Fictibacillus barbaricus]|nr:hypothetical protein [Fictibacillus barbaricus]